MGQTLTHGVYLPSEGERNCYSGLASNWRLLDGAIGTVAAHTTAIAGKADISHSHGNISNDGKVGTDANKPLITGTGGAVQAGSFGTSANTFCEGNDSRLSDARTPVAHTHTKSDVTDLFNSANTWSALNTYANGQLALKATSQEIGVIPTADRVQFLSFSDKNNEQIGVVGIWYNSSGSTEMKFYVSDKFKDGVKDPTGTKTSEIMSLGMASNGDKFFTFEGKLGTSLYPFTTNLYNIGNSTNQWNNLYAKNYYYNGTAWGLDKGNVWSKTQDFVGEYQGTEFSANYRTCFAMYGRFDTVGKSGMFFTKFRPYKAQGSLDSSDVIQYGVDVLENEIRTNNVFDLQASGYDSNTGKFTKIDVVSGVSNANLGTSINKWKSFNGINPGALSLPDNSGYTNISGNITDLTGSVNSYTPPFDGYVMVNVNPNSNNYAYVSLERVTVRSSSETTSGKNAMATIPVIGGKSIDISVIGASIAQARFTPCLGNV